MDRVWEAQREHLANMKNHLVNKELDLPLLEKDAKSSSIDDEK